MRTYNTHNRMQPALLLTMLFMLLAPFNSLAQDTRTDVATVVAASDIADIIVYGKEVKEPSFTMAEGSIANIPSSMIILEKKDESGNWNRYNDATFTEGSYRVSVQVRVDYSYGKTHKLAEGWTLTVDGQAWTIDGKPTIEDTYSFGWAASPEIILEKVAMPLTFNSNPNYNIPENYVGLAIKEISVANGVIGGEEPYRFSKTSGPEWINVSENGTISGTPASTGTNNNLVVRVTDNKNDYKEITISVGNTFINPNTRTDVTTVAATSDMAEIIAYGNDVKIPTFTMAEGSIANISSSMIILEKKGESGNWNRYNDQTFTEGTYRVGVQVRVDYEYGRSHKLAEGWTLTVDEQTWTTEGKPSVEDTYSFGWASSPEIIVKKDPATGIISVNNEKVAAKKQDAFHYNLAGQRVGNDYRGVVIHNGQKYLRK